MSSIHSCSGLSVEIQIPPCSLSFQRVTGLPEGGRPGQYLEMTEAGARWGELPADLADKGYVDSAVAAAAGSIAGALDRINGEVI